MDGITGLPIAFGKQSKQLTSSSSTSAGPSHPTGNPEGNSVNRGGGESGGGRGARGVVGGGKRNRGRGRGGAGGGNVDGGHGSRVHQNTDTMFNGGVKRPHSSSHTSLPAPPPFRPPNPGSSPYPSITRHNPNNMDLGIRGSLGGNGGMAQNGVHGNVHAFQQDMRGGGRGRGRGGAGRGGGRGGGGGGGGHATPEKGFYKPSFVEDPWKALLEARERTRG